MIKINPTDKEIDWLSEDNYFFMNQKKDHFRDTSFLESLSLKGHLFIMTSGSMQRKCIALSKKAFLNSACSVNDHLKVTEKDRWMVALPFFHVGGLSILARGFESKSPVISYQKKWNASHFVSSLEKEKITLTSLVPTQLYDIVSANLTSPSHLRVLLIGGGSLHHSLYKQARKLHWPVLPTYGMTENSSQVATASLLSLQGKDFPPLQILNHCQVQIKDKKIVLQSSSLLTGWFSVVNFNLEELGKNKLHFNVIPHNSWFETEDEGKIENQNLEIYGKLYSIKICGENTSLYELENILLGVLLELKAPLRYVILENSHRRQGYQIDLITDHQDFRILSKIISKFNNRVAPYEKIENSYYISCFPRGSLDKIDKTELRKELGFI